MVRSRTSLSLLPLALAVGIALTGVASFELTARAAAAKAAAKPAAKTTKAPADSLPRLMAAVKKDSTDAKAAYKLGIAYLDRDQPIEAIKAFSLATRNKPDYLEAWVNLGAAQDANGHGVDARTAYRTALSIRPTDEIAMCRLASSFYAVGMRDSAMEVMRNQIKANPKASCAYFTLGVAFADAGMFRDAIKSWQKVVEYSPGSPEAESAGESIKLLQEYLGPQEALAPKVVMPEGVAMGAGGPNTTIPGGAMNASQSKETEKLTKKANSEDMKEAHGTKDDDKKKK
jgi:Flp pilus assembly protein TadD